MTRVVPGKKGACFGAKQGVGERTGHLQVKRKAGENAKAGDRQGDGVGLRKKRSVTLPLSVKSGKEKDQIRGGCTPSQRLVHRKRVRRYRETHTPKTTVLKTLEGGRGGS